MRVLEVVVVVSSDVIDRDTAEGTPPPEEGGGPTAALKGVEPADSNS